MARRCQAIDGQQGRRGRGALVCFAALIRVLWALFFFPLPSGAQPEALAVGCRLSPSPTARQLTRRQKDGYPKAETSSVPCVCVIARWAGALDLIGCFAAFSTAGVGQRVASKAVNPLSNITSGLFFIESDYTD